MSTQDPALPGDRFVLQVDLKDFGIRGCAAARAGEDPLAALSGFVQDGGRPVTGDAAARCLLAAYGRDGLHLSARLLGQYAAVIIDRRAGRIVLVQDSLGLKTLYYATDRSGLTLSSDLRTVVALTGAADLDRKYFAAFLGTGHKPPFRTPYQGISRLGRGTTVWIERGSTRALRPWSPPFDPQGRRAPSASDLRGLLDEAVRAMLPAEGAVLCDLSGGLDSTAVLLTARKFRPDVQALTLVGGGAVDDERHAREIVDTLGLRWHTLDLEAHAPYSRQPAEPLAEPGDEDVFPLQAARLTKLQQENIAVSLTGHFGDALFGAAGGLLAYHLADPVSRGRLFRAIRVARSWRDGWYPERSWIHPFVQFGIKPAWRHWRGRSLEELRSAPEWLSSPLLREMDPTLDEELRTGPRVREAGKQYLWDLAFRSAEILSVDYRSVAGADVRHPLMSRPLVEAMLAIDSEGRFSSSGDRVLQRAALADRLPAAVLSRTTKGRFQEIYDRAFAANGDWLRMLTESPRLVALGWVDPEKWAQTVARARFGVVSRRRELDAAISTECWLRAREAGAAGS